jgi:hypothetical protein
MYGSRRFDEATNNKKPSPLRDTSCPQKCERHTLKLVLGDNKNSLPKELSVRLCKPEQPEGRQSCFPRPNPLREIHYPMFIQENNVQRVKKSAIEYENQFERWKLSHINCLDLSAKDTEKLQYPKVKNHYCHVCHLGFVDYVEHINSSEHNKMIENNPIKDLIDRHIKNFLPRFPEEEEDIYTQSLIQAADNLRKIHRLFARLNRRIARRDRSSPSLK